MGQSSMDHPTYVAVTAPDLKMMTIQSNTSTLNLKMIVHFIIHMTLHYNPSGETEDAARNRRFQTNRQFALSKANHAYYKTVSESRLKKPPYSNKRLIRNFLLANHNLKVKWQECSAAYAEKLVMAKKHNKPMEPRTKTELLNNLKRKYRFFEKKLFRLPLVLVLTLT